MTVLLDELGSTEVLELRVLVLLLRSRLALLALLSGLELMTHDN